MPHGDITHVELPVSDFARSSQLYADLFGWTISEAPGFEGYPMWQAPNAISGGALTGRDTFTQPLSYVEVDAIDEVLAKVVAAGGSVTAPKSPITDTSWFAVFTDPDGNLVGLFEGSM